MSKKKLFWIAFFGLTLVEIGQMAYSHDNTETLATTVMANSQAVTRQCNTSANSELSSQHNSVYGQPRFMLI